MNKQELIEKYKAQLKDCTPFGRLVSHDLIVSHFLDDLKQLDEPQKPVVVPQLVADWIEVCKEHLTNSLYLAMTPSFLKANNQGIELTIWIKKNEETFARAWLDGYEIEKQKRYLVKVIGMSKFYECLNFDTTENRWKFFDCDNTKTYRTHHTRKELEEAGFGWIFDCKGIEVKEVKE